MGTFSFFSDGAEEHPANDAVAAAPAANNAPPLRNMRLEIFSILPSFSWA